MDVKIIKGPEKGKWTVRVANEFLLIEGVSERREVRIGQFPVIGFNSSEINQDSLILGEKEEAERSSIQFFIKEMARVRDRVPNEIRKQLYDSFF